MTIREKLQEEIDMLKRNVNRLCGTSDISELATQESYIRKRIQTIR